MLSHIRVVLAAVACAIALTSVELDAQLVTVGAKGGFNVSNLSVNDPADPDFGFDSQTDFLIGLFGQLTVGRIFTVQPEVYYSKQGARTRGQDPEITLNLNYIELPLLLMARLTSRESPIYPILYTGPKVSFETRCQATATEDGLELSVGCDDPLLDDELRTKNTDFGLVFGGGLEVLYSRLTVQLDARYNLGLTNLNDSDNRDEVSVKSRGWSFLLGFGVPIG